MLICLSYNIYLEIRYFSNRIYEKTLKKLYLFFPEIIYFLLFNYWSLYSKLFKSFTRYLIQTYRNTTNLNLNICKILSICIYFLHRNIRNYFVALYEQRSVSKNIRGRGRSAHCSCMRQVGGGKWRGRGEKERSSVHFGFRILPDLFNNKGENSTENRVDYYNF